MEMDPWEIKTEKSGNPEIHGNPEKEVVCICCKLHTNVTSEVQ